MKLFAKRRYVGGGGKSYASLCCCVAETTLTLRVECSVSSAEWQKSFGAHVVHAKELKENDGALLESQWGEFERKEKPGHRKDGKATFAAISIKKRRLVKNAVTMVALHGNRVRFITVTTKHPLTGKKDFLYAWENLRKDLSKHGYTFNYSGMPERQDGKRRGDGIGRMVWHFHALAYLSEDDWNYREIQAIAKKRGFNIDFQCLRMKCRRVSKQIAEYASKLDGVVEAAYAAKMETGEDYVYTLTSKGCDLPRRKRIYDMRKARELIDGFGFRRESYEIGGKEFFYYLLENEFFGREIYDTC